MSDGDASNSSNQTQAEARKTANVESVLAQQPAASTEKTTIANPGNTSSSPSSQNATTTTSPATPTTTLREDLIKSAVSFLSSPNVRSAETAKKVAFLRQKGLSQEEIEEAFKRVGDSTSMTATVQQSQPSSAVVAGPPRPAVPPRPAAMYQAPPPPPQVVYYNPPPPPAMPLQRIIAMAFILGFGAVGITAAILKVIKRFIGPIFETIANYQRGRYNERKSLWEKLQDKLKEDDSNSSESSTALLQKSESLAKSLERIVDLARDRAEDVRDEPYSEFRDKLNDFKSTLSDPDHIFSSFSSYTLYAPMGMNSREPKAVQDFKSEIRSFKGMLLNRRNFPMVNTPKFPLSPSATTSSPSPTTTVRDVPIYYPRRRQSYRSELAQETDSSQISSSSTPALEKNPV